MQTPAFRKRVLPIAGAALALLATAACDSFSRSRLHVINATPAHRAENIAPDSTVAVRFSFSVATRSVSTNSFAVLGSASGVHEGSFTFDEADRRVTFDPTAQFIRGETVTVNLSAAIRSTAGAALVRRSLQFTILPPVGPPPSEPLVVVSSLPAPSAQDVPMLTTVTVELSGFVNPFSVTPDTVHISGSDSGAVEFRIAEILATGRILRLEPLRPLSAGETVTVSLERAITAIDGSQFAGHAFSFRVEALPPSPRGREAKTFHTPSQPVAIDAGDLDGDGVPEIALGLLGDGRIEVLALEDEDALVSVLSVTTGLAVHTLTLADIDGDRDVDVLVGAGDRARIYVNRTREPGQGDELRLDPSTEAMTDGAALAAVVTDLDHQGAGDIVLATTRGLFLHLDGLGSAPDQTLVRWDVNHAAAVVADIDRDGHLDVVAAGEAPELVVFRGRGDGRMDAGTRVELPARAARLVADDVSRDGIPDIVVLPLAGAGPAQAGIVICVKNPIGAGFTVTLAGDVGAQTAPGGLAVADIGGDGTLDLVAALASDGRVDAFAGRAGMPFFALDSAATLASAAELADLVVADVNGDGVLDVAIGTGSDLLLLLSATDLDPPPPATFRFQVENVQANPGGLNVSTAVRMTSSVAVEALSVTIRYDTSAVAAARPRTDGLVTSTADFSTSSVDPASGTVSFHAVMALLPGSLGQAIPAGQLTEVLRVELDISATAAAGESALRLAASSGDTTPANQVVAGGLSFTPELVSGTLRVLVVDPPPSEGPNVLRVDSAAVTAGDLVSLAVKATHDVEIEAFTAIAAYDPASLEILELSLVGSVSETLQPELVIPAIQPVEGYFALSVLFDLIPPFENKLIPAGENHVLFFARARALPDASPGDYAVVLRDGLGVPPLANIFSSGGRSHYPDLRAGLVTVRPIVGGALFVRGDANTDGIVNVADVTFIMDWLASEVPSPACLDRLDLNDSGAIDISDATYLLEYLFAGSGHPPIPPFPTAGGDPTADPLPCSSA